MRIHCFILFLFVFSCTAKKEDLTSKVYVLKEIQDSKTANSLHQFPIMAELLVTEEKKSQLNFQLNNKNNFDEYAVGCFEPEMGYRIVEPHKSVKVILISISCARIYIYQNKKKQEYILSQLGRDNFRKLFTENFPEYEAKVLP